MLNCLSYISKIVWWLPMWWGPRPGIWKVLFSLFFSSFFLFLFLFLFFSSLHFLVCPSLGGPFSSGAHGHCPPMPPSRYATAFSVLKHPISPKDPTENSLIFVTKRRPFLFLVDFVTERPQPFKCLMYISLYKSCAPGYLHPLSILSQSTSVSPTDVLPRSIMQGQRPSGTRRAAARKAFRVNYTRVRITHA